MTDKDVQKLRRGELLEMLIEQSKEVETLRTELAEANRKLEDRKIKIEKAGSIAEASCMMSGIFEAAQSAAQLYLENIQYLNDNQEKICEEKFAKVKAECEALEAETQAKCDAMEKETEEKCKEMLEAAKQGAAKQWADISTKLTNFYEAHKGLREIISLVGEVPGIDVVDGVEETMEECV